MTRQKVILGIFGLVLSMGLAACTHQAAVDRKVDAELKDQPPVSMGGPMAAESRRLITESSELTQSQKDRLLALHSKMAAEMTNIRNEEGRLKMVFFKTLLNPKSDEAEIANLRTRIIKLDRSKTDKMLSALEESKEILGRRTFKDERLYRAFNMDSPGRPDLF
ncbi:MAG: hypothetical protein ACXWQO_13950 [Bdellovibrionota bacterium]